MSKLLLTLWLLGSNGTFCTGYRQGFLAAYCSGHLFCRSAPTPACPDEEGDFQTGYNRGYDDGLTVHGCDHAPCN